MITILGYFAFLCSLLGASIPYAALPQTAPKDVPEKLKAPASEQLVLETHATGWQIYVCQAGPDEKLAWVFKAPEAELHNASRGTIGSHYAGPAWKLNDGSEVTGKVVARQDAPDAGSVPWLLLNAAGHSGDGTLTRVTTIQRLHTKGGQPPQASTCDDSHKGTEAKRPYSADYYFYAPAR